MQFFSSHHFSLHCTFYFISRDPKLGLRDLYEFVSSKVKRSGGGEAESEEWGPPVLLVDDLSVLLTLGVTVGAVLDFSHYCQATICSKLQVRFLLMK